MSTIKIPTPLRPYAGGQSKIQVQGNTVAEILDQLVEDYPDIRQHIMNGNGELRPFVNLFLNGENVKDLQGAETPLGKDDRLMLIPSIAGGSK
jgi:molybdopterin converting factor small subunit